ncbi:MAG: Na+/H+ antiporter subunit D [Balneolales bacterium]
MTHLLVLPIIIPLLTACLAVIARKSNKLQRWLGVLGMVAQIIVSILLLWTVMTDGILADQMGNWAAPFGITLVADLLSAIMIVITAVMGFAVAVYSLADIDKTRESFSYYPLLHLLLMGVNGTFLTGDIFNLYVWFEVMLISSFVLLALGNEKTQMEGAIKYVIINIISSAFLLAGTGLMYGMFGTLNMADLANRVADFESPGMVTAVSMLFMVSFSIKAAMFPLFFWLPASYHTPPVAISAIFAGLLTKVGVYTLIRFFTLIFVQDVAYTHTILLWAAGLTMLTGVLGAASQNEFRKILSFHIISQIGYMVMGLALFTPLAIVGSVFYIVHHIIVKTNLFLVSGVANRLVGSFELSKMGGLYRHYPWLGVLFLIPAFSLAGFPPLSGFWAKLTLIYAALEIESYPIVIVALVVGLLTLFSMTKIWAAAFWSPLSGEKPDISGYKSRITPWDMAMLVIPMVILAMLTLTIGLYAQPFFEISLEAAEQLLEPSVYIQAVLGNNP